MTNPRAQEVVYANAGSVRAAAEQGVAASLRANYPEHGVHAAQNLRFSVVGQVHCLPGGGVAAFEVDYAMSTKGTVGDERRLICRDYRLRRPAVAERRLPLVHGDDAARVRGRRKTMCCVHPEGESIRDESADARRTLPDKRDRALRDGHRAVESAQVSDRKRACTGLHERARARDAGRLDSDVDLQPGLAVHFDADQLRSNWLGLRQGSRLLVEPFLHQVVARRKLLAFGKFALVQDDFSHPYAAGLRRAVLPQPDRGDVRPSGRVELGQREFAGRRHARCGSRRAIGVYLAGHDHIRRVVARIHQRSWIGRSPQEVVEIDVGTVHGIVGAAERASAGVVARRPDDEGASDGVKRARKQHCPPSSRLRERPEVDGVVAGELHFRTQVRRMRVGTVCRHGAAVAVWRTRQHALVVGMPGEDAALAVHFADHHARLVGGVEVKRRRGGEPAVVVQLVVGADVALRDLYDLAALHGNFHSVDFLHFERAGAGLDDAPAGRRQGADASSPLWHVDNGVGADRNLLDIRNAVGLETRIAGGLAVQPLLEQAGGSVLHLFVCKDSAPHGQLGEAEAAAAGVLHPSDAVCRQIAWRANCDNLVARRQVSKFDAVALNPVDEHGVVFAGVCIVFHQNAADVRVRIVIIADEPLTVAAWHIFMP